MYIGGLTRREIRILAITLQWIGIFQKFFQSYRERPPSEHIYSFLFLKVWSEMADPFCQKFGLRYVWFSATIFTNKKHHMKGAFLGILAIFFGSMKTGPKWKMHFENSPCCKTYLENSSENFLTDFFWQNKDQCRRFIAAVDSKPMSLSWMSWQFQVDITYNFYFID